MRPNRQADRQSIDRTLGLFDDVLGVGRVEPNQLVEHDSRERTLGQRTEREECVADVADSGSPEVQGLAYPTADAIDDRFRRHIGLTSTRCNYLPHPRG